MLKKINYNIWRNDAYWQRGWHSVANWMTEHHCYRSNEDRSNQLQCLLVSGVANPMKLTSPDPLLIHQNFDWKCTNNWTTIFEGMMLTGTEDDIELPVEWWNTILIDLMKIASSTYSVYLSLE